jgi:hypothetical protein
VGNLNPKRGNSECRACGFRDIKSVLDLGFQPLPSEYGITPEETLETFPLHMRICPNCGLGQLGEYVLPRRIFHDTYPYLSSASSTWLDHAKKYALEMHQNLELNSESLVLELASNDGYLLSEFKKIGTPVLGIEPASNVASIARKAGVPTLNVFFGAEVAKKVLSLYGHPKLIVANNVFAHIPDMHDFTEGMAILCDEDTVITIENPCFATLLKNRLFDTIYHEHYSYLSAHSVQTIANAHGLELFQVDKLTTHGGSNRYWLGRSQEISDTVKLTLEKERSEGLFDPLMWKDFANRSKASIAALEEWLTAKKKAGDIVVGYGAAHKGNTFLNAVGESSKILKYVVDASSEKQGKFLPGSQIPVLEPNELSLANPTDVLILPWNIAEEISARVRMLAPKARIWVALPILHEI